MSALRRHPDNGALRPRRSMNTCGSRRFWSTFSTSPGAEDVFGPLSHCLVAADPEPTICYALATGAVGTVRRNGAHLEDVETFGKFLGGSPTNVAVGAARLVPRAHCLLGVGGGVGIVLGLVLTPAPSYPPAPSLRAPSPSWLSRPSLPESPSWLASRGARRRGVPRAQGPARTEDGGREDDGHRARENWRWGRRKRPARCERAGW